jgi:hypothetical protein
MYVHHGAGESVLWKAVVQSEPAVSVGRKRRVGIEIIGEDDTSGVGVGRRQINYGQYRRRRVAGPSKRGCDRIATLYDYTFHLCPLSLCTTLECTMRATSKIERFTV